ncbi:ornithine decarboxylase antizyme 1-like isoform X2 [Paramacrobiotus metropolitanus]|uniref:ornithine decarboxylase antizyme 1-like isoform X2 n=1 Tax=Paramacrobiotus metropolitanus TaxID=2943436 RepID=UPI00244653B7|nr:ornithine decarboxylase antizyme 1-like isoform X2 [Paramacrobiotus metropolitanus]
MSMSLITSQLACTEGNGVGKSNKPSVNKKIQGLSAHNHEGRPAAGPVPEKKTAANSASVPVHIHFKYRLTDSLEGVWATILHGPSRSLYVHIPPNTNGEGSKDSFIRLLEYAEEVLKVTNVVVFFQEDRADANSWLRAFRFLGFQLLPPAHALRPDNQGFIYMNYLID